MALLEQLPPPLKQGRTGFPWTEETRPRTGQHWPKITVVTPSFNQAEFLEETIRSVLLQNYPNLEYIVIDGGSTDGSVEIIQHYSDYLTYWVSEPDNGQADAINKGFSRSTGDIMGWLNSDDLLLSDALYKIATFFCEKKQAKVATGLKKVYDQDSRFRFNVYLGRPTDAFVRHWYLVNQEATYWRQEVWENIGPLDADLMFALDFEYWQRMLNYGYSFELIPSYLAVFRRHEDAKNARLITQRQHEMQRVCRQYSIADSEEEARNIYIRNVDSNHAIRMRFLRDLGHQKISNNPHVMLWAERITYWPVIGAMILQLHNWYRKKRGRYHD